MRTYFVLGKDISHSQVVSPVITQAGIPLVQAPTLQRQTSNHGSFTAVVMEMMQASKRSTVAPSRK